MPSLLLLLLCWLSATAQARPIELHSRHQVAVAMFPEGLQYIGEAELRKHLYPTDHFLFRDSHVSLTGHFSITPAFPRAALIAHVEPIAFLDFTARLNGTWWFGNFSTVIPADGPSFSGTREDRRALIDGGGRYPGWEWRLDLNARLKAKVGPFITVFELEGRRHDAHIFDSTVDWQWFWDSTEMITIARDDWVIDKRNMTFFELLKPPEPGGRKLWVGSFLIWQDAVQSGDRSIRIGPVAMWKPNADPMMPEIKGGFQVWAVSRFVEPWPPYCFLAFEWKPPSRALFPR